MNEVIIGCSIFIVSTQAITKFFEITMDTSVCHALTHTLTDILSLSLSLSAIVIGWTVTQLRLDEDATVMVGEEDTAICFRVLSMPDNRQATITVVARPVEGTGTGE